MTDLELYRLAYQREPAKWKGLPLLPPPHVMDMLRRVADHYESEIATLEYRIMDLEGEIQYLEADVESARYGSKG